MRDQHAAFTGSDLAIRPETQAGNAPPAPGIVSTVGGAKSLGGIFNHGNFHARAQRDQLRKLRGISERQRGQHRLGLLADPLCCRFGIHVQTHGIDINEHWSGANIEDAVGHAAVAEGGDEHFIAWPDAKCAECNFNGDCARGHADSKGTARSFRDELLKLKEAWPHAQRAASQGVDHQLDVGFEDLGAVQRNDGIGSRVGHGNSYQAK